MFVFCKIIIVNSIGKISFLAGLTNFIGKQFEWEASIPLTGNSTVFCRVKETVKSLFC